MFLCSLQQQCPNRMKTYGAIIETMKNNNTPTNHMKKVAKNIVFVFGEDITAPQFFSSTTTKTKQRPRKKSSPYAKTKLRPNSFFTHTAKTKKRTPQKNVRLRRIRRNNNGACGAGMLQPQNPMLRQASHGLRRVSREMAISTQMLRQRNSATAN